ncbi:thrombospondin type 3 repeat-containing protein [Sandaracinus amylolyticus]|uniref:thrombospondin type 3 repeat-containing protein n=1 Tax=Sandaracinus amylolyticus TaxID=927083 RepID=UPI001F2EF33F|nr:hypothetical protein [Sandaracinus amylolyticus]UJR86942.1 Hypothetical protein I5071_90430 [Sandaracinus amylolyticus]
MTSHVSPRTLPGVSLRTILARSLRSIAVLAALVMLVATISGCPRRRNPWLFDAGPEGDGGGDDSDRDGLCDENELSRGLRIDDPDTDADGYSDLTEVSLGHNPLSRMSPSAERVIFLRETATGTARATVSIAVDGAGETFSGSFTPAAQVVPDEVDADVYFAGAGPVGAEPMGNVFSMDESTQSFIGVRGRTLLTYDVRFQFSGEARDCMRAYPFQYTVKREDGLLIANERYTLVVVPGSGRLEDEVWCPFAPCL